jgi:uncharacterized protein YndB with AHSA1/START domain
MDARSESEATPRKNSTTIERTSERELVVTRNVNGPARLVFEAWTNSELFMKWWVPKSFGLTVLSFEADIRTGGQYRLVFAHGDSEMAFFGKYLDVTPHSRVVWTNEESGEAGPVTTVTFEDHGDQTRIVMHELYLSKEALDAAMSSGEKSGMDETFTQLEEVVAGLAASVGSD